MRLWDPLLAELGGTLERSRMEHKRPCVRGCGRLTTSTVGVCWRCQRAEQGTLLDRPGEREAKPGDSQVQPGEPWPEEMF